MLLVSIQVRQISVNVEQEEVEIVAEAGEEIVAGDDGEYNLYKFIWFNTHDLVTNSTSIF